MRIEIEVWVRPWFLYRPIDEVMMQTVLTVYSSHYLRMIGRGHRYLASPIVFAPLHLFYASLANIPDVPDGYEETETLWVADFNSTRQLGMRIDLPGMPWVVSPAVQLHYFGGPVVLLLTRHMDYANTINYAQN